VFKNYLIIAIRHIMRNKFVSAINIMSLSIGLAAALMVMLFVQHELSYDQWIPGAQDIYRYEIEITDPGGPSTFVPLSPQQTSESLLDRFSEIEKSIHFQVNLHSLHLENKVHYEWMLFAEEDFFEVLDLPLVEGNKTTALSGGNSALLSEEKAFKYFGDRSPLGETLTVEVLEGGEKRDFVVTGVFRDIPRNSHLDIDFILSNQPNIEGLGFQADESWHSFIVYTFLKLKKGANPELVEAGFPALMDDMVDSTRFDEPATGSKLYRPYLNRLTDIHMNNSRIADPFRPPGDWGLLYALSGIALLVLAIASINFMNLALARSLNRSREVSMRKVLGARRGQLISQYLGETALLTLVALGFAVFLVTLALPSLNIFIDKDLAVETLLSLNMILPLLALLGFVAFIAGLYPAFVVTSFRPAAVFRSSQRKSGGKHFLRNALVVFQFAICIALGIAATVIQSQRHFTANKDLGFSTDDKLVLRWMNWGHFAEKSPVINERIRALPEVTGTAYSSIVPGDLGGGFVPLSLSGSSKTGAAGDDQIRARPQNVDEGFFDVYEVKLLAGRFFSREFGVDNLDDEPPEEGEVLRVSTIMNETALRRLGFASADEALGITLDVGRDNLEPFVVGVVEDFHFSSLREEISPIVYYMESSGFGNLTVNFKQGTDIPALVRDITSIWKDFIPRDPITIDFLNELVAAQYENDSRQGMIVTGFATLALIVACMGLFGLSALTSQEKSREVSIRKVYGASITTIVRILLWRFSFPVFLAILLAWPLAWYACRKYLDSFSYRIELGPELFLVAGLTAMLIATLTVGSHALKVARANPINALRVD
jgi:putative ABC transport system permease protein